MCAGALNPLPEPKWKRIVAPVNTDVCLFFIGLFLGSIGDIFPFWTGLRWLAVTAIVMIVIRWASARLEAILISIVLIVFLGWTALSQAPIQAGILTLPGPDLAGLTRAGIEWRDNYSETVIELANATSDNYSDLGILISSSDEIYEVGEITKLGCVSIFGPAFRQMHRLHCPNLPGEAVIQIAVVTAALNRPRSFGDIPENLFLPPRPPANMKVTAKYLNGKHPYECSIDKDAEPIIERAEICRTGLLTALGNLLGE